VSEWTPPLNPVAISPRSERVMLVRVLVPLVAFLGAGIAGLFVLDWFDAHTPGGLRVGFGEGSAFSTDLHSVRLCEEPSSHCTVPLKYMTPYPGFHWFLILSRLTYWISLTFGAIVLLQVGSRLLTDRTHKILSVIGYAAGALAMASVTATAYVFGPELHYFFIVEPTIAPIALLLACGSGIATLYFATRPPNVDIGWQSSVPLARVRQ
jgi:hypothetical protein